MYSVESVPTIEAACLKVTLRFFRCLDTREHEAAAELFAPDGVWNRPSTPLGMTSPSTVLNGRAAILAALQARPAGRATAHLLSNLWAETIDPDHARVHFYLTLRERIAKPNEPAVFYTGGVLYGIDAFVRLAEGWRIQTKGTQPVLAASERQT